jgi:hypothetical protein
MRFKSTYGRTQHIYAKHPNFGINEPDSESQCDDTNTGRGYRPIDSSPSSHTSQFDQADERMVIDSDLPPILSDDLLPLPMTYSPSLSLPPVFDDPSSPFSASQSPAIYPHDGSSDADDVESTGHSQATSPFPASEDLDSSLADTVDAYESASHAFTDYHPILNGKYIHSIRSSALY